jgi:hypothetical protein
MIPNIKLLGLLLFLFFAVPAISSAAAVAAPDSAQSAAQTLQIRYPNYQELKALRAQDEFKYSQDVRPAVSFWQRFWFKVRQFLNKVATAKSYNSFWKYVFYVLAIGIGLYAVLQILQVDLVKMFGRQAKEVPLPYEMHRENIHEIDFTALIAEAENQGDYRRAVRLHYLFILKNLSDKTLITWSPAKTNQSYINEIQHPPIRQAFGQITQLFEYVWYGGSALQEADFKNIRTTFQGLDQIIKLRP